MLRTGPSTGSGQACRTAHDEVLNHESRLTIPEDKMKECIFSNGEPFKERFPLRSLFYGEGLFETLRWKGELPIFWNKHIERMKKGAGVLGIPFPGGKAVKEGVENAILDSQIPDAYVKICLLSHGTTIFYDNPEGHSLLVIVREYKHTLEPVRAHVSSFRRSSTSPILQLKSLNYLENILARREARKLGFDEAIFLSDKEELCEASASNLFWFERETLCTPSLECGILPGVIRGVVIELAKEMGIEVKEGRFGLDSLKSSEGGFFTNSLIGAIAIALVDQFELPITQQFKSVKTTLLEKLGWV